MLDEINVHLSKTKHLYRYRFWECQNQKSGVNKTHSNDLSYGTSKFKDCFPNATGKLAWIHTIWVNKIALQIKEYLDGLSLLQHSLLPLALHPGTLQNLNWILSVSDMTSVSLSDSPSRWPKKWGWKSDKFPYCWLRQHNSNISLMLFAILTTGKTQFCFPNITRPLQETWFLFASKMDSSTGWNEQSWN